MENMSGENKLEYRLAQEKDIEGVLTLHARYHVDTVSDQDREDGFVTTMLTRNLLLELIEENGLFVAADNEEIVAYVMAGSWDYCSRWPLFRYMIERLGEIEFLGHRLNTENSYQYGPVCIDKPYRGTGVLEKIFDLARKEMHRKYPVLVTFVNKKNPRSVKAHVEKLGLRPVTEFEFNGNSYLELVYDASKPLYEDLSS